VKHSEGSARWFVLTDVSLTDMGYRYTLRASTIDAAGEPQWHLVSGSVASVTTRSLTRLKFVTQGSPAASTIVPYK